MAIICLNEMTCFPVSNVIDLKIPLNVRFLDIGDHFKHMSSPVGQTIEYLLK